MTKPPLSDEDILRFLSSLWQLNRRVKQDAQPILEAHDLDLRRFFLLITIRKGAIYPKQISEQLQIPSTLLSRYIDQLVKQGFLERQIDTQDSRRTQLRLTAQGEDTFRAAVEAIKAHNRERLAQIEPAQLWAMLDGLEALLGLGETGAAAHASAPAKPQENHT